MKQSGPVAVDTSNTHIDIPVEVRWTTEAQHTFAQLLQSEGRSHTEGMAGVSGTWPLFQLCQTATLARLAGDFGEMLALDHIHGFTPLPHQLETAKRVLQDLRGRAILADEVGLGKTIEAGLILKEYLLRQLVKRVLVLAPASLILQWTRELYEKFGIQAHPQKKAYAWNEYDIIVASLDSAKREPHRTLVLENEWDIVIVDEAHKLKNQKTRNWQLVNQISTKYMLLLTATPVQNHLQELHTLITLLKPGQLGSSGDFASSHLVSARRAKDPAQLRSNVKTVMIRNRRRDGGVHLPQRRVEIVPVQLNAQERELYDGVHSFLREEYHARLANRGSMLPLMTLQREICSSTYAAMLTLERMLKRSTSERSVRVLSQLMKMAEQVKEYTKVQKVVEMIEGIDDKCIIFTEYRATQDFVMYMLRQRGITCVPFRGGFNRGKKDWMKDLFAGKARVLVATESGGEGINLQFCHHMINFDLPWNPMRLEQRIGRIHRLGQQQEVKIYHLSTQDTIESYIVELLQDKIRMFETVVGEVEQILDNTKSVSKFEKTLFEASMNAESDADVRQRVADPFGNPKAMTTPRQEGLTPCP